MINITKPFYKTWWGAGLAVILTAILIFITAIGFYFFASVKKSKLEISQTGLKLSGQQYSAADGDHYWLSADKAKITIVEFGDFACSDCGNAFYTIREISLKYKDDVKLIWRDYPAQICSDILTLAGRCTGEQGLFWPMHDKLFQNQTAIISLINPNENQCSNDDKIKITEQLLILANQIGVDTARFNDCLTKQKYLPQIQKDLADGQTFGITGTPTYFINGYKIAGDIPYDVFIKIIEELKK
ncbi:MAG: thioredoxin domain-containing protein [Patescibacteria group bacterium]|jgi:protein-disulfide isomerase